MWARGSERQQAAAECAWTSTSRSFSGVGCSKQGRQGIGRHLRVVFLFGVGGSSSRRQPVLVRQPVLLPLTLTLPSFQSLPVS